MRATSLASTPDAIAAAVGEAFEDAARVLGPEERGALAFADGLFTAAAIGPERTYPHEWMRILFGSDHVFADIDQAQAALSIVTLAYNKILDELQRDGPDYVPRFLDQAEDGEAIELAGQWANGFIAGMQLRGKAWKDLVDSKAARPILVPILLFLTLEDGTGPLLAGSAQELAEMRGESLALLGPAIHAVDRYWKAHGRRSASAPIDPYRKIGRNEPCLCGSGKKYKKCCLDRAA
jgi:uncharacterized protein